MTAADDLARRVAEAMLAAEAAGPARGVELEEAREGYARIALTLREDMLNTHGIAHGGAVFTLADVAFACACNGRNIATVAQQASIVFLSAAHAGERLVAEAREAASEGRTGVYEITVTVAGRTVAQFQGLSRTIGGTVVEA